MEMLRNRVRDNLYNLYFLRDRLEAKLDPRERERERERERDTNIS